jgi:hypothetical protein
MYYIAILFLQHLFVYDLSTPTSKYKKPTTAAMCIMPNNMAAIHSLKDNFMVINLDIS